MSELEELHDLIESAVEDVCYNAESYGPSSLAYGVAADAAKALIAAGYRKPRTITTAEELDALARGAVVLSDVYISNHGQAISFQRWEDGAWHRGARSASTHSDNFLPATVLYEPAA